MIRGMISRAAMVAGVLGLVVVPAAAPEASAQRWGGGSRAGGGWVGGWGGAIRDGVGSITVERVIRLADELELTGAQRGQLESLRVELLEARTSRATQQMALLSEIEAGIREPEAMRATAREFAEQSRESLGGMRDRYQEILTEEQRDELRQLNRRAGWRDRGVRNSRGSGRFDRIRDARARGAMDRWRGAMDRRQGTIGRWRGAMDGRQGRDDPRPQGIGDPRPQWRSAEGFLPGI